MSSHTDAGSRASIETVLAEFESKKKVLTECGGTTKVLIKKFLEDAQIRFQSIQSRIKTDQKLRIKYLDEKKGYRGLSDITDLLAVRVITYYEDEVDRVSEVIRREFDVDAKRSVDKR